MLGAGEQVALGAEEQVVLGAGEKLGGIRSWGAGGLFP